MRIVQMSVQSDRSLFKITLKRKLSYTLKSVQQDRISKQIVLLDRLGPKKNCPEPKFQIVLLDRLLPKKPFLSLKTRVLDKVDFLDFQGRQSQGKILSIIFRRRIRIRRENLRKVKGKKVSDVKLHWWLAIVTSQKKRAWDY